MTPQVVSHYRIEEKLGEGGMGVVYKAWDLKLDRPVALKFLSSGHGTDEEFGRRFEREAKAASALDHPNICTVHEIDQDADGRMFIVMAYYAGETLRQRLERGPLPVAEAAAIMAQIAAGLERAHAIGLVHRDIKPLNIIVTPEGIVKILDFGLAKVAGGAELTQTGTTLGTAAYMSPQQALGQPVDARCDVWAMGVILYQMLAGHRPFPGEAIPALVYGIVNTEPKPLREIRPEVPEGLAAVVTRALEKDPKSRYPDAGEFLRHLEAAVPGSGSIRTAPDRRRRHPKAMIAGIAAAVALVAAAAWYLRGQGRAQWARETALPEIARLAEQGRYVPAFDLARQVEELTPKDPLLARLMPEVSIEMSIESDPPGADVSMKEYADVKAEWRFAGQTPLVRLRVPHGYFRWRLTKAGYSPAEGAGGDMVRNLRFLLDKEGTAPTGMLRVSGGRLGVRFAGTGLLGPVALPDYWLDKYEVTNKQFKEFVDGGGYSKREYWKEPMVKDGRPVQWAEAMRMFRDSTGSPGPATWEAGSFPEGREDFPVGGVSWYEAAAYAEFAGKQLPTVFHWGRAAGPQTAGYNVSLSHFGGGGPVAVGSSQGMSPAGAYDLAGNLREWCRNEIGNGRTTLGGAWDEPTYLHNRLIPVPPIDRSARNGFRCIRTISEGPDSARLNAKVESSYRDYNKEKPVDDRTFELLQAPYAFERTDLQARVLAVESGSETWRKEKVTFAAAYGGEKVTAYLFLPRNGTPPFQTLILFPGAGVNTALSSEDLLGLDVLDFVIRSGRAVMYPIYKGTYERRIEPDIAENPVGHRDRLVMQAKDFRRSLDYLQTRADIDAGKLGYYGHSFGGVQGPVLLALDPRPKVAIFWDAGFTLQRRLPEGDALNFAPRMKTPVLMLNGRFDFIFPVEASQVPMFRTLGAPPKDKRHVIYETAHNVFAERNKVIREVLDWLDRYLGPVQR